MGRLLNPGVGELVDRLTILHLKCDRAPLNADPSHFHAERADIQMRLDKHVAAHPEIPDGRLAEKVKELQEINARIWDMEDQMAVHARRPFIVLDARKALIVGELGIKIWQANQLRNVTIQEINELAGTVRGPEKL